METCLQKSMPCQSADGGMVSTHSEHHEMSRHRIAKSSPFTLLYLLSETVHREPETTLSTFANLIPSPRTRTYMYHWAVL
jgi:hypothetical protein